MLRRILAPLALACALLVGGAAEGGPGELRKYQEMTSLTLDEAMEIALTHNRDVKRARAELERVGGMRIIEKSRFLPHLDVLGGYDRSQQNSADSVVRDLSSGSHVGGAEVGDNGTDSAVVRDRSLSARLTQRLFEFGRDPASLVSLRQDQRDAFFGLETSAATTLREVRETFFSILLRQEQIRARQENLSKFEDFLEREQKRFEKRESQLADVLTAQLSVSQEELRINSLTRDLNNTKMELMQLLGRPIALSVRLEGELEPFELGEEECVAIGLKNSIAVALAKEELAEQRRAVKEVATGYYPDLNVRSGVENKRDAFGLDLTRQGASDTWAVDASAEHFFIRDNARFQRFQDQNSGYEDVGDDYVWFVNVDVVVPIFQGFERKGELVREKARMKQLRIDLENEASLAELNIRQAHQRLREQKKAVELQQETLEISRERLRIIVRLREFGRATEDDVENFRDRFFAEQDRLFSEQDQLVRQQESVRQLIRMFE